MNSKAETQSTAKSETTADEKVRQKKGTRSGKFKIAICVFSLLLFAAIDLALGSFVIKDPQSSFRSAHPYYHHALRADQNRLTHWGGHRYRMITNSLALRDSETRDVPLRSDATRVLIIGDSMIEGLGVKYEKTVAGRLQERWAPKGIEVLNAAVVSYSPHLYYLKIRYLLEEVGLHFDHAIVCIDISDIQDETFYENFQPANASFSPSDWWHQHSLLARVAALNSAEGPKQSNRFRTDAEVNVWMEATDAYQTGSDPEIGRWEWTIDDALYQQWGKKGLELASQHMLQLKDLCQNHAVDLSVVIYPSPTQIYANDKDSRQREFWRGFCDETKIPLIDLFPTFIDHTVAGPDEIYQRYYLPGDTHWSPSGHGLVAEIIDRTVGPKLSGLPVKQD